MSLDESTGLPELPEGYFWRVREVGGTKYADSLYVCLMRRRWYGATEVERAMASQNSAWGPTMAHALRARAQHVVEDQFRTTTPDFAALLGDYPPKILRTSSDAGDS
jgi:hypothetical protein